MSIFQKKNTSIMIVEYLLEKIQSGELKKGDKLLPEREMSEMMGVSRIPLREALCALSVIGVLESRQGDGTFITTQCDPTVLGRIFYDYAVLEGVPLQQILAGRSAIEVECARAAALNSTAEDKAAIRQAAEEHRDALEHMDQDPSGAERVEKSDLRFHRAILDAAHNRFLSMMLTMVSESFYAMYEFNFKDSPAEAKNAMLLTSRIHMALADAIEAGDVKQAEELMRQHGADVERLYLAAEVRQKSGSNS